MMSSKFYRRLGVIGLLYGLLAACASKVPMDLRQQIPDAPQQGQVQSEPGRYIGQEIRWGGEILGLRNGLDSTELEIFSRALFNDGEPRTDGGDGVRFIARVQGFLDPAEYRPGKRIAVRGRLDQAVTRPVGEFPYLYPVVNVEVFHLWPKFEPPPQVIWVRDPFYDPWWPWRPYPARPYHRW
jgi:outer membrane lipoprotein